MNDGTHLSSQYSGSRGKQITEFQASWVYIVCCPCSWQHQKKKRDSCIKWRVCLVNRSELKLESDMKEWEVARLNLQVFLPKCVWEE